VAWQHSSPRYSWSLQQRGLLTGKNALRACAARPQQLMARRLLAALMACAASARFARTAALVAQALRSYIGGDGAERMRAFIMLAAWIDQSSSDATKAAQAAVADNYA
jgi:hypothetical protein